MVREQLRPMEEPATKVFKLWINEEWYIPVDHEGYCVGESAEGALGFVIKLMHDGKHDYFTALKIPRLMGDTHRENAYICELMDQELRAVQLVEMYRTPVPKLNLLGVANATSLLRGQIRTIPGTAEGASWDRAIVMISFKKGKGPRFCLVKEYADGLKFWPDGLMPISSEDYEQIRKLSQGWSQAVFAEGKTNEAQPNLFSIAEALTRNSVGETWYVNLPSVNYNWAPGTLQESISLVHQQEDGSIRSQRGHWKVNEHLELAEQICRALYTLHARNMLHADLRPANIVFQAKPESPTSYLVSDYGSFHQRGANFLGRPQDNSGQTMGPVMVGERASAFYAPERRLGREREASDTAVVYPITTEKGPLLKIVLGWRSDLIDENGKPRQALIEQYIRDASSPDSELRDKILRAGDRVQLRESIFELIEDERRIGDKQVLTCDYNYWQIYHGRVAVRNPASAERGPLSWFPIPRTIELMKWSVATDLYSLGALLLYSIFRNKVDPKDNGSEVEDQFREMLAYLNSESYFNAVWPDLDWLRYCMEDQLRDAPGDTRTHSADTFKALPFTRYNLQPGDRRYEKEPTNLLAAAQDLTNRLTQTAPGIRRIVDGLEYNLAAFVFIIHFALCCLHRRSHFTETPELKRQKGREWEQELPFCEDRRESPETSKATERALNRLKQLQTLLERGELKAMVPKDHKEIGSFDPRPDVSIRIEREQLDGEVKQLKQQIAESLNPELDRLRHNYEEVDKARAKLERFVGATTSQAQALQSALDSINSILQENPGFLSLRSLDKIRRIQEIVQTTHAQLAQTDSIASDGIA